MTELEKKIRAKIPGPDTGIEIRHSICDICTPGAHCGLDVYVKDGEILKVEGTKGFPGSNGKLCTKGASNRQYVYRENRLKYPMRRTGPRGSGQFERITWEEAYTEIAARLNAIKAEYGPESVAWYTGYSKWYRPWLHRMAHSFGSLNYGTESSSCHCATEMAWKTVVGRECRPDLANAKVYIGWGCNTMVSSYTKAQGLRAFRERGGKVIIIDPRVTPTSEKLADIHLRLRSGTDGALALGMASLIISNHWYDAEYVKKYVHGFAEFAAYVKEFTPERTSALTGVPTEQLRAATELYARNCPASIYTPAATITHHTNGYNNMRAILSLQVLLGQIDRVGGQIPSHTSYVYADCGFDTMEDHFVYDVKPQNCKPKIGAERFPVWNALIPEFQAMDMARQIREGTPYPLKALMAFGMNNRMFPQPGEMLEAFEKLELVVATDLVETDVCRHADYVLPVCSSLERSELKGYGGGLLTCTTPAIPPLYESKCDPEVLCDLARYLDLDDELMKSGYEATMRYMISNLSVTLEELREAPLPVKVKELRPYKPGTYLEKGFETPSGKLELSSELIRSIVEETGRTDLDPLPTYCSSFDGADPKQYPLTLIVGSRLTNAIHSRLHEVPWVRSLRPVPTADISAGDAQRLGLKEGDTVALSTAYGSITVQVRPTHTVADGQVFMYHGYREADGNSLVGRDHLDPYSGFPGFRQIRCAVRRVTESMTESWTG